MCVALASFASAAHLPLFAASTNDVDVAALVAAADASGISFCNGWTLSGLESYNANCLKFNTINDSLISTNYPRAVVGLAVSLRCSSIVPTRLLAVVDSGSGVELARFGAPTAADRLQPQVLRFDEAIDLRRFTLKLVGERTTGVWGVGSLSVIMADPVETPTGLRVLRLGATRVRLAWTNSYTAVTNEATLVQFVDTAKGETEVLAWDFAEFSAGGNPADFTDKLPAGLFGERIYSPANTNGICQISNVSRRGVLGVRGLSDYSGMVLRMVAKRYSGDYAKTKVQWTDGTVTNEIQTLSLADEFDILETDLSAVPPNADLLIGDDTALGSRRMLIDAMSLVRHGSVREQTVAVVAFPAVRGENRALSLGMGLPRLVPEGKYRIYLRAFNREGDVSGGTAVVDFTAARPLPSVYSVF